MKKQALSGKWVWIIVAVLVVLVPVLAGLNHSKVEIKDGAVAITDGGKVLQELTLQEIKQLPAIEVKKTIRSGSHGDETGIFTGVPLHVFIDHVDPNLLTKGQQVIAKAPDGFSSTFAVDEVRADDNVLLVYAKDGKPLDKDSGPFRIVVQKDTFGNRSTKLLNEVEVK